MKTQSGQVYGHLTVVAFSHRTEAKSRHYFWHCRCACGAEPVVDAGNLRSGNSTSCGCQQPMLVSAALTTHGEASRARTVEYTAWVSMLGRCLNETDTRFTDYGGRGITICERWRTFENFLADMGRKPSPRHSLDRRDNDGNYDPGNCQWATQSEQVRNQRRSVLVEVDGQKMPLMSTCEARGLSYHTVWQRMNRLGWSVARSLEMGGAS